MGGLLGGGGTVHNEETRLSGFRISTSCYGSEIPIVYGTTRITGNVIDYLDFTAIPHTTTQKTGKGGGQKVENTTYTYTVAAAVGLCEDQVEIGKIWSGKDVKDLTALGLCKYYNQIWPYVVGKYDDRAVTYKNISYCAGVCDLGSSDSLPQISFEVFGKKRLYDETIIANEVLPIQITAAEEQAVTLPIAKQDIVAIELVNYIPKTDIDMITEMIASNKKIHYMMSYPELAIPFSYDGEYLHVTNSARKATYIGVKIRYRHTSDTLQRSDCRPADIIYDLITNSSYGVGLDGAYLEDMQDFKAYCDAANLYLSCALDSSSEAQELLSDLAKCSNSEFLWTNGKLAIRPYCESAISGNGVEYDPKIEARYNLTDDDFIAQEDEDPVKVFRSIAADAYNCVKVEFINAENEYNVDVAEAKDTADIELNGLREADTQSLHYIHSRDTAISIAYMLLRKNLYVRNRCQFSLGMKYCLLEPFDIVTITDEALGYENRPMRILEINETEEGCLEIEAEECLLGIEYGSMNVFNPNDNIYEDNTKIGSINHPAIFTAPYALTGGGIEVWAAVSGKEKDWGGCQIWTSWDNASYRYTTSKYGPSVTGTLQVAITASAQDLIVDVGDSRCELYSVSEADAANMVSLCYLGGEFFTYETAELIAPGQYKLKKLTRGLYGTAKADHLAGDIFTRIDATLQKMKIMQTLASQTAYLKFASFDTKGSNVQELDNAVAYPFHIQLPNIPQVTNLTLTSSGKSVIVDFTVQQSNEYMFSEVYYSETNASSPEIYIYGGMDRQHVVVNNLLAGKTYLFKVLPVITNNAKGSLENAKGKTITLSGLPDTPTGKTGIVLNGVSTYIALPANVLGGKQIFTIELKFCTTEKRSSSSYWNAPCLCGNAIDGINKGDIVIGVRDGKLIGSIQLGYSGGSSIVTNEDISDGSTYSISLISDGSNVAMYKNSLPYPATCDVKRGLANEKLYFGYSLPVGGGRAEMILYEARFWDVVRTPSELGMALTGEESSLRAWYKCEERSGNVLKDSSANKLDGSIIGNVWG